MSSDLFPIRRFPDPVLKRPTRLVDRIDGRVREFIERLVHTMRQAPRCVGLAAPQVGSDLRIAVMDGSGHPKVTSAHGLLVLVNPRLELSGGSSVQREGCLSVPDFTANVRRAAGVRLLAVDQHGSAKEWRLEGFEAIIAQHEVDHLDGTLFLDRVANLGTDVFPRKTYG